MGTLWAFERGAPDFSVFLSAWRLVLEGKGATIYAYQATPDRFLYAPGFAWLLSPLAILPRSVALALWCFAKAAVVGYLVREFQPARRAGTAPLATLGLAAWGVALVARPVLIDFQYGQVNLLILGACVWALLGHFRRGDPASAWDLIRWTVLAMAAMAKVFPLPLLVVPWLATATPKVWRERSGTIVGLALVLAAPLLTQGWDGNLELLARWRDALILRGLPFESHNQSFSALLHRWFSGEPVHVVALGMHPIQMGWSLLSTTVIGLLSLAWIAIAAGVLLAWLLVVRRPSALVWVAVAVALLILPSHLVWKPYFVMFLPVAILVAARTQRSDGEWTALVVAFAAMNLSGFDLVGAAWGARLESASVMLWSALAYLALLNRSVAAAQRA